jgi:hypothetical protein
VILIAATTEPNAAEWFTAVGTVGTLAVSVLLALFALRDRERNRSHEHRAQASNVYGLGTSLGGSGKADGTMMLSYESVVRNNSDLPITDVEVQLGIEPPGAVVGRNQISKHETNFILPGETFRRIVQIDFRTDSGGAVPHEAHLWIAFTDASGTRWERLPGQRLMEQARTRRRWNRWRRGRGVPPRQSQGSKPEVQVD